MDDDTSDIRIRIALLEQSDKNTERRVSGLEANIKWVALLVIGGVIGSVLKSIGVV